MFTRNISLGRPLRLSPFRKVAMGTWRSAGDPSVYGIVDADVGPATAYMERLRAETGLKITLTHFIGRALAEVFARHPEINCILRLGRLYPRQSVDIFFQVATDAAGTDLSGTTIRGADLKTLPEIAQEMQGNVAKIRAEGDPGFKKMKSLMDKVPGILAWPLVNLTGFLMYSLNIWSELFGVPRDPFGSAMVTSLGSLGIDVAFAPLVPYSRVPMLVAVGATRERPVVRDGKIEIALISQLAVTFDHRLIDGVHAARMLTTMKDVLANPATYFEKPKSSHGAFPIK